MCGRFAITMTPDELLEFFSIAMIEDFPARFNVAPTQPIIVIVEGEGNAPGSNLPNRKAVLVRWGFIPGWVKYPKDFPLLINARAETAIEKASFRAAMRHRRVLIPASGFYEWHRPPKESGEKSQAYWVKPRHGKIVAFAGLMETWSSADGSEVDTAAILTCEAPPSFAHIHHRMPVVIEQQDFSRWLDCKNQEPRQVKDLMVPPQDDVFEIIPVSDLVNKVSNTGPEIQTRVDEKTTRTAHKKSAAKSGSGGNTGGGQMSLF
ncbi:SOS response-associated peptidase [Rhizobium sp. L1K21]|uniref:SOS response-associated peptidase n=1 Tax=Rhizobium sp. L1K21 TaxID=2954933 RepID=UPI00209322E6|nr:SOS response-associated peptidase [Rhizobium sp. L1K21]MCO6186572.1 SOS response-associated peptidase [Rhizobium sp. L1K21]